MPADTYRPAPTDLTAPRPAGQTYAVESAPGRLTYDGTKAGHVVKTWHSLRRAQRALATLLDYEPKHTATARVVIFN